MDSRWTKRFDSATLLWEVAFCAEKMSRHDREQIRRDPKGARSFAEFLHEASGRIRAGELPQPPTLPDEHMPFYLPTFAVKEAIRYWVALGRGNSYAPKPPPLDS